MNRKTVSLMGMSALLLTMLYGFQFHGVVRASPNVIKVPDHYLTIQGAINAATTGDIIQVAAGTYHERMFVNKTVSLIGESKSNTVIDGGEAGTVFRVTANNVTVTGFSIENGGRYDWHHGVHLDHCNNSVISKNNFQNNFFGIYLEQSNGNSILQNTMVQNLRGISLLWSNKNNVSCNMISNNFWIGITIGGNENTVIQNTVLSNELGIDLSGSSNNTLKSNNMTGNSYNFSVGGGWLSHFINDIDASNTVDGKPVYYLINQKNLVITPTTFPDIGYLGLINSTNIKVMDLNIANEGQGILLVQTSNSRIQNVSLSHNSRAIMLEYYSEHNVICNNTMSYNGDGIFLGAYVYGNIVRGNTLLKSSVTLLMWALNNTFYYNNFFNSTVEITTPMHAHEWNCDYPFGGNYWSDYTGLDLYSGRYQNETGSDEIGDIPYIIDEYNKDNYPLMRPRNPDITPPIARAGSNLTRYVGEKVSFNASNSTDDIGIVMYEWNFGDGTYENGINVTHIYTNPGTYTVTLTVKDIFDNMCIDSITVTVLSIEVFPPWMAFAILIAAAIGGAVVSIVFLKKKSMWTKRNSSTTAS